MRAFVKPLVAVALLVGLFAFSTPLGTAHAAPAKSARPAGTCDQAVWVAELYSGVQREGNYASAVTLFALVDRYNGTFCGDEYSEGEYQVTTSLCSGQGVYADVEYWSNGHVATYSNGFYHTPCGTWEYMNTNPVALTCNGNTDTGAWAYSNPYYGTAHVSGYYC